MRVGGLGGPSKAGPRIATLCKYFIAEDLGEMWQKKYSFIPIVLRFFEAFEMNSKLLRKRNHERRDFL